MDLPLHSDSLASAPRDLMRLAFCHLEFTDILACTEVCHAWRDLLEESVREQSSGSPWWAGFTRTWPAAAKLELGRSSDVRDLGLRLLRRRRRVPRRRYMLDRIQWAVTITRHGTTRNPLWHSSVDSVDHLVSTSAVIEYAETLEYAHSRPVTYNGEEGGNTGLEWDVELPVPPSYPTSAAAGRGVLLEAETLMETMRREAEWSRAASAAAHRQSLPCSRYLELGVVIFRRSDGRVCCPSEDLQLDLVDTPGETALIFRPARLPSPPQLPIALKARLAPRLPLPVGAVSRDARIRWTLSLEVAVLDEVDGAERGAGRGAFAIGRNARRDDDAHAEDGVTLWGVQLDPASLVHVEPATPSLHALFESTLHWE